MESRISGAVYNQGVFQKSVTKGKAHGFRGGKGWAAERVLMVARMGMVVALMSQRKSKMSVLHLSSISISSILSICEEVVTVTYLDLFHGPRLNDPHDLYSCCPFDRFFFPSL